MTNDLCIEEVPNADGTDVIQLEVPCLYPEEPEFDPPGTAYDDFYRFNDRKYEGI